MYLGAHMMNDYYWPINMPEAEDKEFKNNVQFAPELAVVARRKITKGEEIFVNYNIEGLTGLGVEK